MPESSVWLRIYIGEADRWQGRPLYQALVELCHREGLAGATVVRGVEGFGANSRIHTARILRMSEDLPLIVEVIDRRDRVEALLPLLDGMLDNGLVLLVDARAITYRGGARQGGDA